MVDLIAEFCQNHNGDEKILDDMIQAAAANGATHGKIQTIFADDVTFRERFEEGEMDDEKISVIRRPWKTEVDRLRALELSYEQQATFVDKCHKARLHPLTTAFTRGSIPKIKEAGFRSVKVASYDCGSLPLIRELQENFEELIISTGATYDYEIAATATYLKNKNAKFKMLHCVTIYPTPLEEIHLNRMKYLKQYTRNVGLSEHTLTERDGIKASAAAIYCGACVIERHFTVLDSNDSRDGPVSLRPKDLKELSEFAKMSREHQKAWLKENVPEFGVMLGKETRVLSSAELLNRDYYRGRFATHVRGEPIYNWDDKEFPCQKSVFLE